MGSWLATVSRPKAKLPIGGAAVIAVASSRCSWPDPESEPEPTSCRRAELMLPVLSGGVTEKLYSSEPLGPVSVICPELVWRLMHVP
jgi:hypothetical protein